MRKYKVKYQLMFGNQEIDLSVFVDYEKDVLEYEEDINNVINKADITLNKKLHIPIDVLNDAEIDIIPAP